jgi:hypothetical protein
MHSAISNSKNRKSCRLDLRGIAIRSNPNIPIDIAIAGPMQRLPDYHPNILSTSGMIDEAFEQLRHSDRLASPGFAISYQPLNHNGGPIRTESAPGQDACL